MGNRPIVYFGKYIWIDPFFTNGYARVKLLDNKNWGVIDTFGRIAVFPNLEYIWPLKSEKSPIKGWRGTTTIKGKYKGEIVGYLIDQMSVVNLPIDFEFEPDIDLEDIINPQPKSRGQHDEKIRHFTTYAPDYEEWDDYERPEYEDYIDDAFEGDPSAYWNID